MIIDLEAVRATDIPRVGGKGANLGELIAAGLPVPGGFCVTADASFAGQQQTILGLVGADAVLEAIRQYWASPEQPRASPTARTCAWTGRRGGWRIFPDGNALLAPPHRPRCQTQVVHSGHAYGDQTGAQPEHGRRPPGSHGRRGCHRHRAGSASVAAQHRHRRRSAIPPEASWPVHTPGNGTGALADCTGRTGLHRRASSSPTRGLARGPLNSGGHLPGLLRRSVRDSQRSPAICPAPLDGNVGSASRVITSAAHRSRPSPAPRRHSDIPGHPLLDRVGLLDITREVHRAAEDIRPHVKTLDALHLATAVTLERTLDTPLTIATHDKTMTAVAHQLGLRTVDPVTHGDPPQA